MTGQDQIREHMPVVCADGQPHGQVDRLDGEYIKLTKDESGQHHWLPLSAVDHVDEHVHLNLSHAQVHQQWLSVDPHPEHRQ
ncbi:DUF2171 domain-containing protein (plasmid) [Deinococcus sp. VB343]|jgi:hypothetical protein|uniref:DUF2171 domain-containing protein n=5 Tax=Deinococcus TaxID=1298 RepID=A0A2T3W3I2_9DEIO|nr:MULTISPECIES: DUF2171 domain-containing protein [Deinococcus]MBZ9715471.1 DUF2171 domain-containing protein [Deinococcus multiflagellatus]PTA66432.1 hypothetical protein C8263_17945 [Deinococcus arcticus]